MSLEMTSRWQLPKKISETGYRERHLKNNPSKKYQIKIDWQVKYKKKKKTAPTLRQDETVTSFYLMPIRKK
jgi:hypothetical protein